MMPAWIVAIALIIAAGGIVIVALGAYAFASLIGAKNVGTNDTDLAVTAERIDHAYMKIACNAGRNLEDGLGVR